MTGKAGSPTGARRAAPTPPALARGPRVVLRELTEADADAFVTAACASLPLHRPWVRPPSTLPAFRTWIGRKQGDGRWLPLLAVRRADGALLGVFNLSEIIRGPLQQAFLGYYAFAPHAGQGYMREALEGVLDIAFRKLKLHRIEANIQPANGASIALVRACGFVREGFSPRYLKIGGRWRDHERWAINADAWKARRGAAGNLRSAAGNAS